jgi:hypothetical protein
MTRAIVMTIIVSIARAAMNNCLFGKVVYENRYLIVQI